MNKNQRQTTPDGRLKRIEYRGRHLRASRTGGVALRAQTKAAGVNLTANSARGARVSTRIAKGTQAAFQNGRFVLRGRYGDGPNKINLSKSGVSVSSKTAIGTFNWFKPRYSSAKIGGIQVRGKNAIYLNLIVGLFQLAAYALIFLAQALVLLVQGLYWLGVQIYLGAQTLIARIRERRLRPVEDRWRAQLDHWEPTRLKAAFDYIFLKLATGHPLEPARMTGDADEAATDLADLLNGCPLVPPRDLELLFACLAASYADQTSPDECLDRLLKLDERAVELGGRNQLQERLLIAGLNACGAEGETVEEPA
mgnify:CR=1 FL=1